MPKLIDGVLNYASIYDDKTVEQAKQIAELPFVYPYVALMPDAHVGKGSSVGTVIPTVGGVIPAAVGVDIGCGMIAVETNIFYDEIVDYDLAILRESIESAIPLSPGNYNKSLDRYDFTSERIERLEQKAIKDGVDLSHSPKWREQLGSLGGGNHFIELCVDERNVVWLTLHSGSRGVGNKIAQKHIKVARGLMERHGIELPDKDLAYLSEGSDEFAEYVVELHWAQLFAYENRAEMMDRYIRAFKHWIGAGMHDEVEDDRINCHHNYTTRETHQGYSMWITRKGAIDAHEGKRGMIPGSMGDKSFIVRGKGEESAFCSAPHGAGRKHSRTQAKKLFTADDLAERMTGIEYRHGDAWVDEIPDAYKPIQTVMDDSADLVNIEHTLVQILNVKGL